MLRRLCAKRLEASETQAKDAGFWRRCPEQHSERERERRRERERERERDNGERSNMEAAKRKRPYSHMSWR